MPNTQGTPGSAYERVGMEWFKWAVAVKRPSAGLRFLKDTGWLRHFPEIAALDGTPQDPDWHPEGDVFTHTSHCCDALAELPKWREADETTRGVLMFAVLAHDFAKPQTTHEAEREGRMRIVSPGHEEQGGPLAEAFLRRTANGVSFMAFFFTRMTSNSHSTSLSRNCENSE